MGRFIIIAAISITGWISIRHRRSVSCLGGIKYRVTASAYGERGVSGRNENRCLANGTFDEKRTVKFPSVAAAEGRGECRAVVPPPLYSMPAFRSLIVHSFKFRFEREARRSGSCAQKCSNRLVTGSVVPEAVFTQPSALL